MSRQMEERSRILREMKDRYGEDDPMVSQWTDYLETSASFEFLYPSRSPGHHRFGGSMEAPDFKFRQATTVASPALMQIPHRG
jgi:hypothetical protein